MRKKREDIVAEQSVTEPTEEINCATADEPSRIREFLQTVLNKMGLNCTVEAQENDDAVALVISGEDASVAIGYRGETLDALQYLCSLQLNGKNSSFRRVTLDAEGYRAKREKTLERLAMNLEQKVKRTGREAKLEPMNPYERRVIHTTLQNSKYVTTQSEGQGSSRHVVISPIQQNDILNSPNAPRKTLNFVYRSEKKRRR
ncbi:MAG: protein jag [Clostridiales bacterium]|nr:protein jag [Clostridiales bacterium]